MAGKKRDKDRLKDHARVEAVASTVQPPRDDGDLLRWSTLHKDDATDVDLHEFAQGQTEHRYRNGGWAKNWDGPFTGRPELIRELAPHMKQLTLPVASSTVANYLKALRRFWRLFDALEATPLPGGQRLARVESVADLTTFHEAAAHQHGVSARAFEDFCRLANHALQARGLRELNWTAPDAPVPDRQLINDKMAKALRVALKYNWRAVQQDWSLRDKVRAEADRRDQGEQPVDLGPEGERLLANWRAFQQAARKTGKILPSSEALRAGRSKEQLKNASLTLTEMRAMQFPTVWETDAAYHMALLDSAWNPSTMLNVDATDRNCVAPSIKDSEAHLVLHSNEGDDASSPENGDGELDSVSAPKPRARGKLQIAHSLAKNQCSAPFIVRAFIARTDPLREVLRERLRNAIAGHSRLEAADAGHEALSQSYQRIQKLRRGVRCVWLYVNPDGRIHWFKKEDTGCRHRSGDGPKPNKQIAYLAKVIKQLASLGKSVGHVTPSDLRDLAARTYFQKTGSIIALMLKLGHSRLRTTTEYLENNLFRAENDEVARRFLDHLFGELAQGRLDLTILAQLSRHGPLTPDMQTRLIEYRSLMRSRIGVGCSDPRNPPKSVDPKHRPGQLCGSSACTAPCPNARYLPESLDGMAMRAEELRAISDLIPREAWLREGFHEEQLHTEALLDRYYPATEVAAARAQWRARIVSSHHRIPGYELALDSAEEIA